MYQNIKFECGEKFERSDYAFPPQHQNRQPGFEYVMKPVPTSECGKTCCKLADKVALVTGGDSGIGRAVAYDFVKQGASVAIVYYDEETDARETSEKIKELGGECLLICGDLKDPSFAKYCVDRTIERFGKLDILVNNHAMQFIHRSILDIPHEEIEFIFRNNVFSFFYMIQYALPYMKKGGSIINTTSVTAYEGNKDLIDYSATKGAIVALTRSLSLSLVEKGIRVNGVAPGPIWTPLIPASFSAEEVATFGKKTSHVPMDRAGQPCEVSPCYVFLASDDSGYMTGQVLHPNGGTIVGS
ncbi:MAG: SDR family oxidoreductase [Lachnospiraceae bacterium]|nr:SDR family oxidoreductase [Lachnospiraceae bacterium]